MSRAAILIGANRTGHLPVLQDAAAGARRMAQWALAQGMAQDRVVLFTDEAGPIDVADIRRAVRALVDAGTLQQLIVYFAGHGVNIRYGEYWLLTDAPEDASAAVNVEGSVVLARRCGIGHVVFISDACRTAAEGVQAQGVTGIEIFPNDPVPGPEGPVDIFFAATLGRPALEVKDPAVSSAAFKAVYTATFLDAVSGRLPAALTHTTVQGQPADVVRPRPLKMLLLAELPRRLAALRLPAAVTQVPDARITSDEDAWLARLTPKPVAATPPSGPRAVPPGPSAPITTPAPMYLSVPLPITAEARACIQLASALDLGAATTLQPTRGAVRNALFNAGLPNLDRSSAPPRPPVRATADAGLHFDTGCGFEVRGSAVLQAWSGRAQVQVQVMPDPTRVRVQLPETGGSVLLQLRDGTGALLPALPGFVTRLVLKDDELVDVAFEPLRDTPRWAAFEQVADALRTLRRAVSLAARDNAFRPEPAMIDRLTERMVYAGHLDPSLALYAAHSCHELQQSARIAPLAQALRADLGVDLFDLLLLAGDRMQASETRCVPRLPQVPLLVRGWTLLSALGVTLPEPLMGIGRHLQPSLWTHFTRAGCDQLRDLMTQGRLT